MIENIFSKFKQEVEKRKNLKCKYYLKNKNIFMVHCAIYVNYFYISVRKSLNEDIKNGKNSKYL